MKTALVVGGTSGIGLGIAEELLQKGINAIVIGRRPLDEKNNLKVGQKFTSIQADLANDKSINLVKEKLSGQTLDYVIFSAATEEPLSEFSKISKDAYDYAFDLNLKMPFFLTQAIASNLNKGARILFLTSRLSNAPESGSLVYCMTKSALEVFSKGLNKECAGEIFCSSVIPGVVDTEMQKRLREADPKFFANAHVYQKMQPRLLTIKVSSEKIVTHLCESSDEMFSMQRVNLFDATTKLVSNL